MGYLYDKMVEALGGSKLLGRQDLDYGNWTPSGVRSVGLFRDVIVVEYHPPYNRGKVSLTPLKLPEVLKDLQREQKMKNPLDAFTHKKFMALEEVIIDSMVTLDVTKFLSRSVDPKARFRQLSVVNWSESMSKAYVGRLQGFRQKDANSLIVKGMGMQVQASQAGPGASDWFARYSLTSSVYKSDRRDGALEKYFRHIAGKNGISQMEAVDGEELTEREILNIRQHRQNVKADVAGLAQLNELMNQIMRLKNGKDSPNADTRSASSLHKHLVQAVKRGSGTVPGLRYYLDTYQEEDSIPQELIELYKKLGYLDDKSNPSKGRVDEASGYFNYQTGIVSSVRAVYKERKSRKLYVPDTDRYIPTLANLNEFVSLVLSEQFDYIKYSSALEEIAQSGDDVELAERIKRRLAEAEKSDKEQVSDTARVIRKTMNEDKSAANAEFLAKVKSGSVSAGRDVYLTHVSGTASTAVNDNFGWISKLLLGGLKTYAAKGKPWAFILNPVIDAVGNVGGDHLLELINKMLDDLDKYAEGDRVDGGDLSPSKEQSLIGLFEQQIYWGFGCELMYRFLSDVKSFSNLKKRQVSRLARSRVGIAGLEAFLDRHKDLTGMYAKELYSEWDYLKVVDGRKDDSINLNQNMLLTPREFYLKVFENFNKLSNRQEKRAQKIIQAAPGPHALAELDSLCRESLGLQSRSYGTYSPQHREKDPGMIEQARGFISNSIEDRGAVATRDEDKLNRAQSYRAQIQSTRPSEPDIRGV